MDSRIPLFKTLHAEVVTYDPVITKYNTFFGLQVFLALWHLTLVGIVIFNMAYDGKFDWFAFGITWIVIDTVVMLGIWLSYRMWIKSCTALPFETQRNRKERVLVIGKPMHASISRSILAVSIMYTLLLFIFGYILIASTEFNGLIESSIELTLLQSLLTFSVFTVIALIMSMASMVWPLANVQDVMVCVPTTKAA